MAHAVARLAVSRNDSSATENLVVSLLRGIARCDLATCLRGELFVSSHVWGHAPPLGPPALCLALSRPEPPSTMVKYAKEAENATKSAKVRACSCAVAVVVWACRSSACAAQLRTSSDHRCWIHVKQQRRPCGGQRRPPFAGVPMRPCSKIHSAAAGWCSSKRRACMRPVCVGARLGSARALQEHA